LNDTLLIALVVLHLIAVADVWTSRLSTGAKVLWSFNVLFLVGAGFVGWLITRHTAHEPLAATIPGGDHNPLT
jgi:hypothetical protein